jgi:hypothetical protein
MLMKRPKGMIPEILVLGLGVVATLLAAGLYLHESRIAGGQQAVAQMVSQNATALGQLLNESVAYSRTDPSIVPLLERISGRSAGTNVRSAAPIVTPNRR